MNQIKYVLDACLIAVMGVMAIYLYDTFPSGNASNENDAVPVLATASKEDVQSKGYRLFKQQCGGCHHMDKEVAGPKLRNVSERGPWSDKENLKKWIRNPKAFAVTSPYAKALMDQYGLPMTSFEHLTEEEIDEIVGYITTKKEPVN